MSKVSAEVINILYQHVKNSVLLSDGQKPNGKLVKLTRLVNSKLEDMVINALPLTREDVQMGVLNFNMYVPNLVVTHDGVTDRSLPDMERIGYLSGLANEVFQETWEDAGTYCFETLSDEIYPDENDQHYINFRIKFYAINN